MLTVIVIKTHTRIMQKSLFFKENKLLNKEYKLNKNNLILRFDVNSIYTFFASLYLICTHIFSW